MSAHFLLRLSQFLEPSGLAVALMMEEILAFTSLLEGGFAGSVLGTGLPIKGMMGLPHFFLYLFQGKEGFPGSGLQSRENWGSGNADG